MGTQNQRDGDFATEFFKAQREVEGDPGDGLRRIQFPIEEHVADGGPARLLREGDRNAVGFEQTEFLGDRHWGAIVEGNEA